jgi:glutathione synthase/RimK-type ligase-like ATP-grasp enzyme
MDNTDGWSIDADLAIEPLRALGWEVDTVAWRNSAIDWNAYDAVYIGTPWDYPEDVGLFLRVLERIDAARPVLVNDLALVRWGIPKTYLRDLAGRGADIVPGLWFDSLVPQQLPTFFERLQSDRLVIKPVVSTNAKDTFLLDRNTAVANEELLMNTFRDRAFMVQPFIEAIRTEGEFSLFYFGGTLSHAIQKVPKARDFRVQEEHGASITALLPEAPLVACADRILALVEPEPVYARCDLVSGPDGRFLLMELELIEPSMYLRMHPDAPQRFAVAFDRYVAGRVRS